jgi:fibronectin type 3 domain-containing protein
MSEKTAKFAGLSAGRQKAKRGLLPRRKALVRAALASIEQLESRQLLSGTGLTDTVWHGAESNASPNLNPTLTRDVFGGDNAALARVTNYAATHAATADYSFINTGDQFLYAGGSAASTPTFLNNGTDPMGVPSGDANGKALTDPVDVATTIFDAEGYFVTTDAGTYTMTAGGSDDIAGIYIGGNGTPGSGTLVSASGWQGATSPLGSITLPANSSIPVEIIYGNGFGGANLNGVSITDPNSTQVVYNTSIVAGAPEPAPDVPALSALAGNAQVQLTWNAGNYANTFSVYRGTGTATPTLLKPGVSGTSYTDSTVANNSTYTYYITADNASGSSAPSNTVTAQPVAGVTAAPTNINLTRTNATTVQVAFTAPPFGSNYSISRSTSATGPFTTITPSGGISTTSFTDTNAPVAGNTDYYYIVTSTNSAGSTPSAAAFIGHGDGFQASYYSSDTQNSFIYSGDQTANVVLTQPDGTAIPANDPQPATNPPANSAVLGFVRNENSAIQLGGPNANTGTAVPGAPSNFNSIETAAGGNGIGSDFAVRWLGYFQPENTGYYTLMPRSDDGIAVTVFDTTHLANGQPTPVTLQPDNLYLLPAGRGAATDSDPVVDSTGAPVLWTAGTKYLIQVDYNQGIGGYEADLFASASSTAANQAAMTYDVQSSTLIQPSQVEAPVPMFQTIDAANPTGLAKDQPYYTASAAAGNQAVELTFSNTGADSYNIYRSTSATGPFAQINTSPVPATTGAPVVYDDNAGLTNGTKYYYIITGVDASGETPINLATGQTSGLTTSATPVASTLTTPTNVTAGRIGESSTIQVSYSPVQFATSYDVKRGTAVNPDGSLGGTIVDVTPGGVAGTTVNDTNTAPGNTYYYTVTASSASTASAPSAAVMVAGIAMTSGLNDGVFHLGNNGAPFGGDLAALGRVSTYAASNAPNYTFTNTADTFNYQGGTGATTPAFLQSDAADAALTDMNNVGNTIFDAQGYIVAPTAGTYTFTIGNGLGGQADDIVGVYVGGNGTPGSGTLVAADGWQGATSPLKVSASMPGQATFMIPAAGDVPVEIIYGNGFGGANLNGVTITDPSNMQVAYVTLPPPGAGVTLTGTSFNDGTGTANQAQRSEVRKIVLAFSSAIQLGAGAVTLGAYSGNDTTGTLSDASAALGAPTTTDGGLTWTIPVLANTAFSDATGSLKDGIYKVTVDPSKVTGGTLAGTNLSTTFHRLYGDIDGNKTVNSADYFKFKAAFGSTTGQSNFNADFDFDGNGKINSSDYFKFKANFGRKFTY